MAPDLTRGSTTSFLINSIANSSCQALRDAQGMELEKIAETAKEASAEMKQGVVEFKEAKNKFHESIVATDT